MTGCTCILRMITKIKIINTSIISHWSEWPSSKRPQTINFGEGVEKRDASCTVGGNVNWYSHYGERFGDALEIYT